MLIAISESNVQCVNYSISPYEEDIFAEMSPKTQKHSMFRKSFYRNGLYKSPW